MPGLGIRSVAVGVALALSLAVSAGAQDTAAKDAWSSLRAFALENGIQISVSGATDFGTSLTVEGVRMFPQDDPRALVVEMDSLRIEPRGDRVALIPSEAVTVTARPRSGVERQYALRPEGEISYHITEDEIDFAALFEALAIELTASTRRNQPTGETLQSSVSGLDLSFRAERSGSAALVLAIDALGYGYGLDRSVGAVSARESADGTIEALRFEVTASELDTLSDDPGMLRQAFDAGFMARVLLTSGAASGRSEQTIGGTVIAVDSVAESSELTIDIVDGMFEAATSSANGRISIGWGPMGGAVDFGTVGLSLGFPLIATPDDRRLHYDLTFDTVVPTPETLAQFGAQDFAGEAVSLALSLAANGRLTEDLGPRFGEGDTPPFDLSDLSLDTLTLQIGETELTGSGALVFVGGLAASIAAEVPFGDGAFVFDLIGGDRLLTRLSDAGLIPQDQQFFARMMMNGLGRPVGEDHLRSDVRLTPDGTVTVNGAPLPF